MEEEEREAWRNIRNSILILEEEGNWIRKEDDLREASLELVTNDRMSGDKGNLEELRLEEEEEKVTGAKRLLGSGMLELANETEVKRKPGQGGLEVAKDRKSGEGICPEELRMGETVLDEVREVVMEGGENTDGQEKHALRSSQKSQGGCQGDHHGVRDKIMKFGGIAKSSSNKSQEDTR